ncbi:PAS domain S-box protein [Desulfosarcina alkanivorans]|nr:PAS domain S-box protein [Desulfosarcina alkanivorans]
MRKQGRRGAPERQQTLPAGILDAMQEPAAVVDANLRILRAAHSFCRAWGCSPQEAEGRMLGELVARPTAASTLKDMLAPLLEADAEPRGETPSVTFTLPGHKERCFRACRIDTQGEAPLQILLSLLDRVDDGDTMAPAGAGEHRSRILADAAFEGIALTRGGVFVDFNDQLARMMGYSRDELLGKAVANCVAAEHRERVAEFMANGKGNPYEHLALRKDGTVFPVEIRARYARIDDQETRITAIRDITERKKAEVALQMFQFTIEHAADAIFWINGDGGFSYVNHQTCRALGYTREEMLTLRLWDIDPVFPRESWDAEWEAYQHGQIGTRHLETLHRRKDGSLFPVDISAKHIWVGDRELHVAFARDISDRKRYEKDLELTQFTVDRASIGCTWIRQDGRFFYVNDQACRSLGYDRQELLKMSVPDIDPEFDAAAWSNYWNLLIRDRVRTFESTHRRKDGRTFPVEIVANYVEFGGQAYSCAFITDISERKQIEQVLELTQFAIDRASLACFWMDPDGHFFYVNDQACRSLGYSREELLQKCGYDIDPGFTAELCRNCWNRIRLERVVTFETSHQRKDGTLFPVEITANFVEFGGNEYGCLFARDITESKRAEEALRLFQFSIDRASDAVFWLDREGNFPYVNDQACRSLGYSREELLGMRLWDVDPGFPQDVWSTKWQEMKAVGNRTFETTHRRRDGTDFPVEVSTNRIHFGDKELHVAFVRDISERKQAEAEKSKLESQLFQSQKMESIGRLAGGVAHDFNNMLGVILGYADLMKADMTPGDPLLNNLIEIEKAAVHSRDITTQLLAFSRKQVVAPRRLDLNDRIREVKSTLARMIGEDVDLQFFPGDGLWAVKFDPTQFEQILINLAVNARDAMPDGGQLIVETVNTHMDDAYCRDLLGFIPGDYVQLSVSDNGFGMDSETLSHVFEPFFTTKEVGKGTGLGLATIFGIVKQGGGFINAYSEPGQGTTFKIYLPRLEDRGEVDAPAEESSLATGTETMLLVEDDEMVRNMTRAMLERIGYTVRVVGTPEEALAIMEGGEASVDLLMTDVIMPGMNGKELRDRAAAARPELKTLFMSGYTANVIVHHGVLDEGVHFIQKPFSFNDLARKIRDALR